MIFVFLIHSQEDNYGRSVQSVNNENRIKALKKEIDGLKQKVDKERERLKTTKGSESSSAKAVAPIDFPVNATFILDPDRASYVLTVEIQVINFVF